MRAAVLFAAVVSLAACEQAKSAPSPEAKAVVGTDGKRHFAIEAGMKGYAPDTIHVHAGEDLVLEFTRTADVECVSQVKVGDGPLVDLPLNKEVDVPVTAPKAGKLTFVCGMDMQTGTIVVN